MRYYLPYMLQNTSAFHSGWVVSTTLAGATVGSFTGGALADKLGRTRTFILDAIPLAVGAFLRCVFLTQFTAVTIYYCSGYNIAMQKPDA
jgi:MFS family permease